MKLPYALRQRIESLDVEDPSDQVMVDRYLAPNAPVFQSSLDFLEALAHPSRLGRAFSNSKRPPPCPIPIEEDS